MSVEVITEKLCKIWNLADHIIYNNIICDQLQTKPHLQEPMLVTFSAQISKHTTCDEL